MTFTVFKQMDVRNRAYVIDSKGNKLFYGTVYRCEQFIKYMNEGGSENGKRETVRTDRDVTR